jgi:hypothetical protein
MINFEEINAISYSVTRNHGEQCEGVWKKSADEIVWHEVTQGWRYLQREVWEFVG